ncbi:hypothetical protein [Mycetocola miduiensis]|uniref:Uncharacterized protein n=1 Tax=Mycetocola miduiensis TaxID=995034 RepID=A0A1I5AUM4_9MICO|nr:hypothetical protein [Mycetocola miduiensis]SFN66111.1 hypothetical protein SAMN05216219_1548 [Mycetocola miduiensis]
MITATQVGRDLHLTVENIPEPFIIKPLPGKVGVQVTDSYLNGAVGAAPDEEITDALMMCVDGAQFDPETGFYIPLPESERHVYNRISEELRLGEAESVLLPAFFWQTVLGIDGVTAFVEAGEGVAGGVKALWALVARLGLSPSRTSPSSALENLIQLQASSPSTSTPQGGAKPGKQPQDRQPAKPKPSAG